VPEDCLLEALNNGTITPDMHRKDVATLLPPKAEPINDPQAVIAEAVDQEVPDTDQQVSDTEPTDDPEVVTESDEHTDAELLQVQTNKQTVAEPGYVSRGLVRELHEINGLLSVCADRMGKLMVVFRLLDDPRSRSRVAGHIPDTVKILKYIRAVAEAIAETQETGDKAGTIAKRVAS